MRCPAGTPKDRRKLASDDEARQTMGTRGHLLCRRRVADRPSHHARPVTASPRATASTRGAACQRMMLDYPEPKRLYSQMMRGSPGMARMSREMMGSGAAA